jgi:hypothetical protein
MLEKNLGVKKHSLAYLISTPTHPARRRNASLIRGIICSIFSQRRFEMNGCRITIRSLAVLVVTAGCSVEFLAPISCAQERKAQPMRMVDYVAPSFLSPPAVSPLPAKAKVIAASEMKEPVWETLITPRSPQTSGDRWLQFDREYGIQRRRPSWMGRALQSAKYGLDTMAFTAQEAAKQLEFTYRFGGDSLASPDNVAVNSTYSLPLFGQFGHPQLKSVLTQYDSQTGAPFVGLKLNIPFGSSGG